jgi:hypothetical protein
VKRRARLAHLLHLDFVESGAKPAGQAWQNTPHPPGLYLPAGQATHLLALGSEPALHVTQPGGVKPEPAAKAERWSFKRSLGTKRSKNANQDGLWMPALGAFWHLDLSVVRVSQIQLHDGAQRKHTYATVASPCKEETAQLRISGSHGFFGGGGLLAACTITSRLPNRARAMRDLLMLTE